MKPWNASLSSLVLEFGDESAGLDERLLVPAADELGAQLSVTTLSLLADLLEGDDRRAQTAEQADGPDRGRDGGDLLGPVRIRRHR
jgi:hypothetical protein